MMVMKMKDANGNSCAVVVGGPDDGTIWYTVNANPGNHFVPVNTTNGRNRPQYCLSDDRERWEFVRFESISEQPT